MQFVRTGHAVEVHRNSITVGRVHEGHLLDEVLSLS